MKTANLSLRSIALCYLFILTCLVHFSCRKIIPEKIFTGVDSFGSLSVPDLITITSNSRWTGVDIIRLDNGTLLAVLGNEYHDQVVSHFDSLYKTLSFDGGFTWSQPEPIDIDPYSGRRYICPTLLKKGSRIYMFIQNILHSDYNDKEGDNPMVCHSDDNGVTWTEPELMLDNPLKSEYIVVTGRNHTVTDSGRIIIPVSHGQKNDPLFELGYIYSNNGVDWFDSPTTISLENTCVAICEPTVAQMYDGRLISLIRAGNRTIYKTFSTDGGLNWSPLEQTSMNSSWTAHTIGVSPEGYLVAVYTDIGINDGTCKAGPRDNFQFAVSYDYGDTWIDKQSIIVQSALNDSDIVMSPSLTLMDNKFLVAFLYGDGSSPYTDYGLKAGMFSKSSVLDDIEDYIHEDWNSLVDWFQWGSGTRQISSGALRLSDNTGTITAAYKYQKLATRYTLEFRTRVQSFVNPVNIGSWSTLGTTYSDGNYRLMIKFESNGIYAMDSNGVWQQYTPPGYMNQLNSWHDWRVTVDNGEANLYMDSNPVPVATFYLERTKYFTGRIGHWTSCGNGSTTDAYVEYSYFTPDIDESIYEHWCVDTNWSKFGSGTNTIVDSVFLHMTDNSNSLTSVYRFEPGSNRYTLKFRAKVNQFVNAGFVTQYSTLGASFQDGAYRSLFKLETDGVYLANDSQYVNIYSGAAWLFFKTNWHVWTIEVDNGSADVYMDGQLIESNFTLQADNSVPGKLQHWTSSISTMPTDVLIDYTYLIYR